MRRMATLRPLLPCPAAAAPRNLEKVWKKEQEAAKEEQKLEELRKQYEEERKKDEFVRIGQEPGTGP